MAYSMSDIHGRLAPFLVTGLSGTGLTPVEREILSRTPPAGVILFHRNVESIEQLQRLTGEVREIVRSASGIAPLIMADHEGGRISVLARAIGAPPSQMAAWKPGSEEYLAGLVSSISRSMRTCGMDLSLSPVADVNSDPSNPVIGTRSFGEDPGSVSEAVRIAVRAMASEGMLSCLKHFPGHGATSCDSHLTLPLIGKSIDQLKKEELPPFIAGIGEGADMVLTAHIALDDGRPPASLDRRIVTGLLREELGFEGVVITDALEMAGALPDGIAMKSIDPAADEKTGDAVPAAIAARVFEAGGDMLLMSRPVEEVYGELSRHALSLGEALSGPAVSGQMRRSAKRITSIREKAVANRALELPDRATVTVSVDLVALPGGPLEPAVPVFLGDRRDFESHVVRRFISRLLERLTGEGLLPPDAPAPVFDGDGGETGLYLLEPSGRPDKGRSLVILCRRPPPADAVLAVASGCASAVVAGRPWDAALLPRGLPVAVTYGIYDAAADALAEMLRERD